MRIIIEQHGCAPQRLGLLAYACITPPTAKDMHGSSNIIWSRFVLGKPRQTAQESPARNRIFTLDFAEKCGSYTLNDHHSTAPNCFLKTT